MKTIIKLGFLSFLAALTFTACEEDPLGGGGPGGPGGGGGPDPATTPATVVLNSGAGLVSDAATVEPSSTFVVSVDVTPGDSLIKAIAVREDGVLIDLSRVSYDGTPAPANPWLIPDGAKTGFVTDIGIVAHADESVKTYTIEITDDADLVSSQVVTITTMAVVVPPSLTIGGSGMPTVSASELVTIPVTVSDVTNPLFSIGVLEDGTLISEDRLWYAEFPDIPFPSNPAELPQEDADGFMSNVYIRAHDTPGVTRTYTIVITDQSGGEYTSDFTITTGSSVLLYERKLFFNADGPEKGAMDLDNGESVSSSSMESEIQDEGIDLNLGQSENWFQRIRGVNGTEVKHLIKLQNGLPETYSFDDIATSEEIAALWDSGTAFSSTNNNGDSVSLIVEIGDNFIAKKNDTYYIFQVTDVNVTTADNLDYYQIDIKL